nr:MAG TPA: hypothetical protein [Caudoviricetes sp.]
MGIKITASGERVFRLRSCSEDDTIFCVFRVLSSDIFYCRFLHQQEPVLILTLIQKNITIVSNH